MSVRTVVTCGNVINNRQYCKTCDKQARARARYGTWRVELPTPGGAHGHRDGAQIPKREVQAARPPQRNACKVDEFVRCQKHPVDMRERRKA